MANTVWNFDTAHTSVAFRIRHAAISWVRGTFSEWNGTLAFDPEHPESVDVTFNVDLASVHTGVADRDEHLRAAALGGDQYKLDGELTLHGVTKLVSFTVTYGGTAVDPYGITRAGFEARTVLDRRDFGLVWNATMETAGHLVGDTVEVTLELEATKA
jgi:polyisoprenoid-binding protein YceI